VLFALFYFSEGAPIGFLWSMLPVILRRSGMEVDAITVLTAALAWPWAFKFVWAPLVDVLRGPRWTLRGWIAASQAAMLATLSPLWLLGPDAVARLPWLGTLLLAHAFAAATQDVAVDALAIRSTPEHELGALNGAMQIGMVLGKSAFGGVALLLATELGGRALVAFLLGVQAAALGANLLYRVDEEARPEGGEAMHARLRAFLATLRAAFGRPRTWVALLFASVSGSAFEAVGATAKLLLVDRGLSDREVGVFLVLTDLVGLGLGGVVGGFLSDRFGRRRVVVTSSVGIAAAVLALASVCDPLAGGSIAATLALLGAVYLGTGFLVASTYALFMDLTDPRLGSTQFSAYMGATNLCEIWSSRLAGHRIRAHGYPAAFSLAAGISVLALPLLALLGRRSGQRPQRPDRPSDTGTRAGETAE